MQLQSEDMDLDSRPEDVRPLKRAELERLVELGFFQGERVELLRGVLCGDAQVRPLKRVEYEKMVELGFFQDEHVELLHGVLVTMTPQGAIHAEVSSVLAEILTLRLHQRATIRCHSPFSAGDESSPEPDVGVYHRRSYAGGHPAEALLLIEVANSSLRHDRALKADVYARAGVPEYWIVDLVHRTVEVWTEPADGQYRRLVTIERGGSIALTAFPEVVIAVDEFLPPA